MQTNVKGSFRETSARARRRSQRLSLRYPLLAYSYSETTGKMRFRELTHTLKVSANGGLVPLDIALGQGETFMLKHGRRLEESMCRVVFLGSDNQTGKNLVGFEFAAHQPDFWHISFPAATNKLAAAAGASSGSRGSFYARD